MNKQLGNGQREQALAAYRTATAERGRASDCISCRKCEAACPQHLSITGYLRQCAESLE